MKTLATLTLTALFGLGATTAYAQMPGEHFIENFDDNGDGQVTMEEVTMKRGEIFYMFDQDENGILDSSEYDLFDATRAADHEGQGNGNGAKGAKGEGMARQATDLNGDGSVTLEEFLKATEVWFTKKDRNGDGVLTTADFGPRSN